MLSPEIHEIIGVVLLTTRNVAVGIGSLSSPTKNAPANWFEPAPRSSRGLTSMTRLYLWPFSIVFGWIDSSVLRGFSLKVYSMLTALSHFGTHVPSVMNSP